MTAICALVAGVIGWQLARFDLIRPVEPLAQQLPSDRHVPFLADLWAHSASYLIGIVGGFVVLGMVSRSRNCMVERGH